MLKELFNGDEELFKGLFVHDRWDWSVHRPVVRIDFSGSHFGETGQAARGSVEPVGGIGSRYQCG